MKLTKLTLEKFKNYDEENFSFPPGTIAICGPNGSGKTSIIEAISWVLFDFIPYKKDIVNNLNTNNQLNSSKNVAKVQVTFISDLDGKEYTVYRNSKGNYFVIDTLTTERVAEKKVEVLEFLKKHYNLGGAANLGDIFRHTIGVPQGMLTSIFMESATERQKVFDKVLNLEDYRKAYEQLKDFRQFLKDLINEQQNVINLLNVYVDKIPELEQQIEQNGNEIKQNELNINALNTNIKDLQCKYDTYELLEKDYNKKTTEIEKEKISLSHLKQNIENTEDLYKSCEEALKELNIVKPQYEKYINIKNHLLAQESKKKAMDELNKQIINEEKQFQNIEFEIKQLHSKLESNENIKIQIKELEPQTIKQERLESERKEIEKLLDKFKENQTTVNRLQKEHKELNDRLNFLNKELTQLNKLKDQSEKFSEINEQHSTVKSNLSEIQSNLLQHQKMALQVKGGLCPFLNEACKNIEEGQDLNTYFKSKIQQFESSMTTIKEDLEVLDAKLKIAKTACEEYNKLCLKQEDKQILTEKLSDLNQDIENTDKLLQELAYVPEKVDQIVKECSLLGSPKDKLVILKNQIVDETAIIIKIKEYESNKNNISNKINLLKDNLSQCGFNEAEYLKLKEELTQLENIHQNYIKLEERSKNLNNYQKQVEALKSQEKTVQEKITQYEKELQEINKTYNPEEYKLIKDQLQDNQLQKARLEVQLKNLLHNIEQQKKQLLEIINQKELLKIEEQTLNEINSMNNFIDISRDIFRNCGPKIGQYYIENISLEANRLYKEITMNENQELHWEIDYEITIEENGVKRSFINLSGGEQMSAALAVRLSLLREISDINIAFFDEPTANMDEIRRQNLAEQIKNIKSFDQLFIISHDDTFEKDIDYVIRLG